MSADNWTRCPRCHENRKKKVTDLEAFLENSYGQIQLDEFLEAQRELKQVKQDVLTDEHYEFREDYETYLDHEGWVQISYRGYCTKCDLKYKFEHSEKVVW